MGIEASWAGGVDGREVIDELLPFIKVTYILHCRYFLLNPFKGLIIT